VNNKIKLLAFLFHYLDAIPLETISSFDFFRFVLICNDLQISLECTKCKKARRI